MWEEIASGHTDGQRLTNYYIDDFALAIDTKNGSKPYAITYAVR